MDLKKSLINVDHCVLIIIDMQDHFLAKLPPQRAKRIVNRVDWLMEVAKALHVPIVATAEDLTRYNGLTATLAEKLPRGTKVFDKNVFDLTNQADIFGEVCKTGRRTAVLVGLETDVCVAHSTIGLIQKGFQAVVLADATDSPSDGHFHGLERVKGAGAVVMSLKGLYYEWIRTVSMSSKMDDELKDAGCPSRIIL